MMLYTHKNKQGEGATNKDRREWKKHFFLTHVFLLLELNILNC